jgi:hypothetical protein
VAVEVDQVVEATQVEQVGQVQLVNLFLLQVVIQVLQL